jgi:hypothetical protein
MPFFWELRPDATGGGGGGSEWVAFTLADSPTKIDPNSIENGAPTMDGDGVTWNVPVSDGAVRNGVTAGLKYAFPVPTGVMDGGNQAVIFEVEWDAAPTGAWSVEVGFFQASVHGLAGGLRHLSASGEWKTQASILGVSVESPESTPSTLVARGILFVPGVWNGTNDNGGTVAVQAGGPAASNAACRTNGSFITSADRASQNLCVIIRHDSTASETETIRFRAKYRLSDLS